MAKGRENGSCNCRVKEFQSNSYHPRSPVFLHSNNKHSPRANRLSVPPLPHCDISRSSVFLCFCLLFKRRNSKILLLQVIIDTNGFCWCIKTQRKTYPFFFLEKLLFIGNLRWATRIFFRGLSLTNASQNDSINFLSHSLTSFRIKFKNFVAIRKFMQLTIGMLKSGKHTTISCVGCSVKKSDRICGKSTSRQDSGISESGINF